jgi:methylated-DNA-[protein]-cysteine S-methyltransferase
MRKTTVTTTTALDVLTDTLHSPIGPLRVATIDGRVCALHFGGEWNEILPRLERRFGPLRATARADEPVRTALLDYLAGRLAAIDALEVDPGGTPFQARVWQTLRRIPAGQTWSYAQLASAIGEPAAVRAVASANARNPVALIVPCHRVIGSDGTLTGYGGGLDRKAWLLRHEGAMGARLY